MLKACCAGENDHGGPWPVITLLLCTRSRNLSSSALFTKCAGQGTGGTYPNCCLPPNSIWRISKQRLVAGSFARSLTLTFCPVLDRQPNRSVHQPSQILLPPSRFLIPTSPHSQPPQSARLL